MAADEDLRLQVLGTAFVVGAAGDRAVCFCAAHSLEHAKRLQFPQPRVPSLTHLPSDASPSEPEYVSVERIKAVFIFGREAVVCNVEQLNYISGNDIAIITVAAPDARKLFVEKLALDFSVPPVGSEVAVLGNMIRDVPLGSQQGHLELQFQMRHGVVTDVFFGQAIPGQSSIFYTSIPVPGGMSGAPVLLRPATGSPLRVCGVVSSDLPDDTSVRSFLAPGRSAVSMLWPSYGLGIMAVGEEGVERYFSVGDLVRTNFLQDHTVSARVAVQQTKEATSILYEDAVHGRISLRTTGHPYAEA